MHTLDEMRTIAYDAINNNKGLRAYFEYIRGTGYPSDIYTVDGDDDVRRMVIFTSGIADNSISVDLTSDNRIVSMMFADDVDQLLVDNSTLPGLLSTISNIVISEEIRDTVSTTSTTIDLSSLRDGFRDIARYHYQALRDLLHTSVDRTHYLYATYTALMAYERRVHQLRCDLMKWSGRADEATADNAVAVRGHYIVPFCTVDDAKIKYAPPQQFRFEIVDNPYPTFICTTDAGVVVEDSIDHLRGIRMGIVRRDNTIVREQSKLFNAIHEDMTRIRQWS